ncbi:putative quinol monooxygenase [Aestuariibius sp. 2305UL40-4]|uniref:putative quinol monooxygenase n=1 Tax=Aestuariibius violaceus TaxID=3234132 RepID=UPI00345EDA82
MIVEYLRYRIDAARQDAFIAAYKAATEPLLASPYATAFDMARCVEDPSQFILRIEWTSAEDHLQRFRGSAEFRAFFAHVKPYVGDILEMRHYERL